MEKKVRGKKLRERSSEAVGNRLGQGRRERMKKFIFFFVVVRAREEDSDFVVEPMRFDNLVGDKTFLLSSF